jgi:hypothetical protein
MIDRSRLDLAGKCAVREQQQSKAVRPARHREAELAVRGPERSQIPDKARDQRRIGRDRLTYCTLPRRAWRHIGS